METAHRKSPVHACWVEFSLKGNCFQKKSSQEHHFWNQLPMYWNSYLHRLWKSFNLRSLQEWSSHGGQNPHPVPMFWLLLGCPFCLCCWCSEVLEIYCAYDIMKVVSFKLWSPRADDQAEVVLSPLCPLVSFPARLEICQCRLWLPLGPRAQYYGVFFLLQYLGSICFLKNIPDWNSPLNPIILQINQVPMVDW